MPGGQAGPAVIWEDFPEVNHGDKWDERDVGFRWAERAQSMSQGGEQPGQPLLCSLIAMFASFIVLFTIRNYYLLNPGFLLILCILVGQEPRLIFSSFYLELGLACGRFSTYIFSIHPDELHWRKQMNWHISSVMKDQAGWHWGSVLVKQQQVIR